MQLREIQALFIVGEDSTTVHLKGYFDGPLRPFVWLVPVPSSSRIEPSHNVIFERLDERTGPRFHVFPEEEATPEHLTNRIGFVPDFPELTYEHERSEGCDYLAYEWFFPIADYVSCPSVHVRLCCWNTSRNETQAVTILAARSYTEVIDWALERGYQAGAMDPEIAQSYLDEGHAILAVEVAPPVHLGGLDRIQPLAFTYSGDRITVPLKSATSEAPATPQKLTVWIAAASRAIPENYLHVRLNEARLNWMDAYGLSPWGWPAANYYQVLSDAIAEAGHPALGTGYAVEGATPGESDEPLADLDSLRNPQSLDAFLRDLWHGGITPRSPWNGPSTELDLRFLQLLRKHIPIPESVLEAIRKDYNGREEGFHAHAESQFYSFPNDYEDHYENEWFDFAGFVDDWAAWIQEPNARARQAMAARPYLTRLTTFYFGDAETVDPVFGFNPGLGQVNDRPSYGKVGFECRDGEAGSYDYSDLIAVVGLEGGTVLRFGFDPEEYSTRILRYGASEIPPPASERIEQLSASGSPVSVGGQITSTIVAGTIPDGRFCRVEFARMISGRRPRYLWSTTATLSGQFEAIISGGDRTGVDGSYQVRALTPYGEMVGEWHDIRLDRDHRQILELVPGERARVVAVERLDAARETGPAEADFDGDGTVGLGDFHLFAEAFGSSDPRFDLDGSGTVDLADFFLLAGHFGRPARAQLLGLARQMIGLPDAPRLRNAPNPFNGDGHLLAPALAGPGGAGDLQCPAAGAHPGGRGPGRGHAPGLLERPGPGRRPGRVGGLPVAAAVPRRGGDEAVALPRVAGLRRTSPRTARRTPGTTGNTDGS